MSDAESRRDAFDRHDAFRPLDDRDGFRIETVTFEATAVVGADAAVETETEVEAEAAVEADAAADPTADSEGAGERAASYRLTVRLPTLDAAVEEDVGPAVLNGWFETLALRLEDAPGAVRDSVDLVDLDVREEPRQGVVVATFAFVVGSPSRAPAVAKAFAEYAEGTYMEGVVPGYTYRGPVAELLSSATHGDGGDGDDDGGSSDRGPMPL